MKKFFIILFLISIFIKSAVFVQAKSFNSAIKEESYSIIVNSKSGPWNPIINSTKDYGFRLKHNQSTPTVIKVNPGYFLTIRYIDGFVYADGKGFPLRKTDADGYPKSMNTFAGELPSVYINADINHMALIGSFSDSRGKIVGKPFFIGNGPVYLVVPQGARGLQMGINDNWFKDNAGFFAVKVNVLDMENF